MLATRTARCDRGILCAFVVRPPQRQCRPALRLGRSPIRGREVWVRASGGGGGRPPSGGEGGGDPAKQRKKRELNLLLDLVVKYPAIRGTFAVLLGYFIHINPLSTLHWSVSDLFLGLQCALPIVALDAAVMLPNWGPARTTRTMRMMVPRAVAERVKLLEAPSSVHQEAGGMEGGSGAGGLPSLPAERSGQAGDDASGGAQPARAAPTATALAERPEAGGGGGGGTPALPPSSDAQLDLVEVERTMTVRAEQHPLRDTLHRTQIDRTMRNAGRGLSPASEAVLLWLMHLGDEMLYRGVLLTGAAAWVTDRLYEAGTDDIVSLAGGLQLPTPAAGAALAAAGMTAAAVALVVQRQLFPLRLLEAGGTRVGAGDGGKKGVDAGAEGRKSEKIAAVLEQVRRSVVRQQRWSVALSVANEAVEWTTLSAAFLLSGNLLVPLAASVAADALFSGWQRLKLRGVAAGQRQQSSEAMAQLKRTSELAKAVVEHRKAKLQTPPPPLGKQGGVEEASPPAGPSDDHSQSDSSDGGGSNVN